MCDWNNTKILRRAKPIEMNQNPPPQIMHNFNAVKNNFVVFQLKPFC